MNFEKPNNNIEQNKKKKFKFHVRIFKRNKIINYKKYFLIILILGLLFPKNIYAMLAPEGVINHKDKQCAIIIPNSASVLKKNWHFVFENINSEIFKKSYKSDFDDVEFIKQCEKLNYKFMDGNIFDNKKVVNKKLEFLLVYILSYLVLIIPIIFNFFNFIWKQEIKTSNILKFILFSFLWIIIWLFVYNL